MEVIIEILKKFVTPEQKQLAVHVELEGGKAIIDNEKAMKKLSDLEASISAPTSMSAPAGMEKDRSAKEFDLAEIQHEIRDDPTEAIEKNAEFFNRKFDIQTRQIQEDIERTVRRQGDRVIEAITAGPHERIVDPVRIFVGSRKFV